MPKFYQDNVKIRFSNTHVKFEDFSYSRETLNDDGVGIDLGIKDLAICSDGTKYKNINKSQKVKKLEKQKRRKLL